MEWIEELFGISPDAGSGTLEALIAGSRILRDWVPATDATVVRKLRNAGAIVIGKLGMHEFAYGISSVNPHWGDVRNPWDTSKIPGGSSGGSAVAVVTGEAFATLGSDTGGSVRI